MRLETAEDIRITSMKLYKTESEKLYVSHFTWRDNMNEFEQISKARKHVQIHGCKYKAKERQPRHADHRTDAPHIASTSRGAQRPPQGRARRLVAGARQEREAEKISRAQEARHGLEQLGRLVEKRHLLRGARRRERLPL